MARKVVKRPCEEALVWFTFMLNRRQWTVWLVPSPTLHRWLNVSKDRYRGACFWKEATILIDANQSPRLLKETAVHEILHACHGVTPEGPYFDSHEKSVRRIEKTLFRVLTRECGLRFPPLPHAWRSLQRRLAKYASQVES